jgi:hypothetical protein
MAGLDPFRALLLEGGAITHRVTPASPVQSQCALCGAPIERTELDSQENGEDYDVQFTMICRSGHRSTVDVVESADA